MKSISNCSSVKKFVLTLLKLIFAGLLIDKNILMSRILKHLMLINLILSRKFLNCRSLVFMAIEKYHVRMSCFLTTYFLSIKTTVLHNQFSSSTTLILVNWCLLRNNGIQLLLRKESLVLAFPLFRWTCSVIEQ